MRIRVLNDYQYEGYTEDGNAIEVGTVIDNAELIEVDWCEGLSAVYAHPVTGAHWISYPGAYEIVED